jgi:hypothetical protein
MPGLLSLCRLEATIALVIRNKLLKTLEKIERLCYTKMNNFIFAYYTHFLKTEAADENIIRQTLEVTEEQQNEEKRVCTSG